MNEKPKTIPSGLDHLVMIRSGAVYVASKTAEHLDDLKINNDLIGTGPSQMPRRSAYVRELARQSVQPRLWCLQSDHFRTVR